METLTCPACGSPSLLPQFEDAQRCPQCAVPAWAALESPFAANSYCGADPNGSTRTFLAGREVVFTSSSSVNYYRGDMRMPAHRYTGSAVLLLGQLTGQSAVAASGQATVLPVREAPERAFADTLRALVGPRSFVFDLRGIRDRSYDVSIGRGPLPDARTDQVVAALVRGCRSRGLEVAVDEPFGALPPWTVTSFAQRELGLSAVQVQVAAALRNPVGAPTFANMLFTVVRAAAAAVC